MRTVHTLIAFSALSLAAQQAQTEHPQVPLPAPPTTLERSEAIREAIAGSPRGLALRSMGVPSMAVTIEGSPIEIPDPPKDVHLAKAHIREVEAHAQAGLAFIDAQLRQLYKDQQQQLAAAKAVPKSLGEGQGSSVHAELWALVRDSSLKEGEQGLVKALTTQMNLQKERAERDQMELETKAKLSKFDAESNKFDREREERDRNGMLRNTIAWEGDEFLKGFSPAWAAFAPKLETYIQTSARLLLELQSKPQPPSTQLLGRLLELQLFERCRALIAFNTQIWRLSAAKVLEPQQFYLAEKSSFRFVN